MYDNPVPAAMMCPSDDALVTALANHTAGALRAIPGKTNHLSASVLVPLRRRTDQAGAPLTVILEARPMHLRLHPGEIVFPGGRPEEGDADLIETALREAVEELGPPLETVQVIGELSSIPLFTSDYRIHPYVGLLTPGAAPFAPAPDEVAEVLEVPIRPWLQRPHLDAIEWDDDGTQSLAPVFDVGGHRPMFGGTAYAFYELLSVLAPLYGTRCPDLRPGRYGWDEVLDAARWAT